MALSKNKTKLFLSLAKKKTRDELGLFVAEGEKLIHQLLEANFNFHTIVGTSLIMKQFSKLNCDVIEATYDEIKKISSLKTPQDVIAICHQPRQKTTPEIKSNELILALDDIQDPGNLGTIIRLASWFGIKQIVCSLQTADCFNSKVIQATMGAIAHVEVSYTNLASYLKNVREAGIPVYGTFLDGEIIYKTSLKSHGIIVMGNEGNGISAEVEALVDHKLFIPTFAENGQNVESLNVGVATSIICSEFKRNSI